jgi:hypothetical protein
MPKEQVVIEQFRGVVQSADARDVDLQVASHMMDIDPISKRGELRGRYADDELNSTAVATNVIQLFRDGDEGAIWDGTDIEHMETISTNPTASGTSATPTSSGTASMASDGQSIRVGLGNGSTHIPKWIGHIEHSQFSGAVGPPSGDEQIVDAPLDTLVIVTDWAVDGAITETNASSAAEAIFPLNSYVGYRINFEYDGFQQAPMRTLSGDSITSANGASDLSFTLDIVASGFPERITAANIWRNVSPTGAVADFRGPWTLVERIDIDDSGWSADGGNYAYSVTDNGAIGPTWEDYTGLPDKSTESDSTPDDNLMINYQYNTMANGYHIVAKVYHSELNDTDNWVFRSLRNRPDMFNWAEDYLVLPIEPNHLETFQGRVYAFSSGQTFRINPETLEVEDRIPGVGLSGPESIITTEDGMFFCNTDNIYFHDGVQIHTVGFPVLNNDYDSALSWHGASHGINPVCTYDGAKNLFIVAFESSSGVYHAFAFNPQRQEWYMYAFNALGGGAPTVGFVSHIGDPIIVFGGNYYHISGDTTRKMWKWVSKEINNGIESIIPYYAFVEGDAVSLFIREEHGTPYGIFLSQNADYDGYMHRVRINSQIRNVDSATSWGRWNKVRMELNGDGTDTVNSLGVKIRRVDLREGSYDADDGGVSTIGDLTPDTAWWIDDASTEAVYSGDISGSLPVTAVLVGSTDSGYAIRHIRVDQRAGYIFTVENDGSSNDLLRRRTTAWADSTTLLTNPTSTSDIFSFCLHRGNQKIYFIEDNSTTGYFVKSIEYDGTGETTLATITPGTKGKGLAINQDATALYWMHSQVGESSDIIKKLTLATSAVTDIATDTALTISGETNTFLVDQDENKLFASGRVPSTSEGIYEMNLASPGSWSLISTTTTASETGLGFDRVNQKIYYVDDSSLQDIYRSDYDGSNEAQVLNSGTANDVKGICLGVD